MYDRKKIGLVQIADIKKNNDYAIWLKICKKTRCYLLDEVLAEYRRGRSGSISTHGYKELIKWHYRLFRFAEKENPICSLVNTIRNMTFNLHFVQDNQSMSTKGVLRGLHFQKQYPQGKLVRVIRGSVFDVAVDLRANSRTYGQWYGVELTEKNKKQFYISEGFAHGFLVLSDMAEFCYKCTDFYHPGDEGGLAWNDPEIGITWPELKGEYNGTASGKRYLLQRLKDKL